MESLKERFENFLKSKGLSEKTLENYFTYFNKFKFFSEVSQEVVNIFLSDPKNQNSNARGFLKHYFKFLMQQGGLTPEQKEKILDIEIPKVTGRKKTKVLRYLTEDQILLLEENLLNESDRLKLILSFYGGLRLSGLMGLKIDSFQWDDWKINPEEPGMAVVIEKGDKERLVYFPSRIMKRVASYIHSKNFQTSQDFLFAPNNKLRFSLRNYSRTWQLHLRNAGISSGITRLDDQNKPIKNTIVHPHLLRHSYGTYLHNVMNVGIKDIQELMGHEDISSTERYTHTDPARLKKLINDL